MTKIGVVSDSHGCFSALERVCEVFRDVSVEYAFHLGDYYADGEKLSQILRANVIVLPGNCDFLNRGLVLRTERIGGVCVLATHGHTCQVKSGLYRLGLAAREAGAKLALFGHTHIACAENDGEVIYVNPGALMDGRYAIIEISDGRIVPKLLTFKSNLL